MPGDPLDPPANGTGSDPLDPLSGDGAILAFLVDRCRIAEKTKTRDGQSSFTETWAQIAEDIPCRLYQARNQKETVQGGSLAVSTVWKIDVPLGTNLAAEHQIDKGGILFEVVDTDKGLTNAVFLTAVVSRARSQKLLW